MKKNILFILMLVFLLCFSGCTSGNFDVIPPPVKEFATPVPYEEAEVFYGDFSIEKSFRGNKKGNLLSVTSDAQTIKGFSLGEAGKVSYVYRGMTYELDAKIISCPTEGSGNFIAEYDDSLNFIPEEFPGKFSVITYKKENSLLVAKKAVLLLDENGNALVLQQDKHGILSEKKVVVGYSNENYYQIIDGINAGEKVVLL